ncbi:MAG: hypothetical protein U0T84_00880 [Chitinophagales bacterium]
MTNGSGCKDTVQIAISSKPNAGTNQTVSCVGTFPGGTATMAATGTGTWTAMASNPHSHDYGQYFSNYYYYDI